MSHPFDGLDDFIALERISGLALSPDGTRLVTAVSSLNSKKTAYQSAVWEIDPVGKNPARRLTRGVKGESAVGFSSAGDVLFTARRASEGVSEDDAATALWRLPHQGGEAELLWHRPGGVGSVIPAGEAEVFVSTTEVLPSASTEAEDAKLRSERKDHKVNAILHTGYPVRFWDSDLGPGRTRLLTGPLTPQADLLASRSVTEATDDDPDAGVSVRSDIRDLTGHQGARYGHAEVSLAADGSWLVTTASESKGPSNISRLEHIDLASGTRQTVISCEEDDVMAPSISPDGRFIAYALESISTPTTAVRVRAALWDSQTQQANELLTEWDNWPGKAVWLPDSTGFLFTADQNGRAPVFAVHLHAFIESGDPSDLPAEPTQVTDDNFAYTNLVVHPDGKQAFAVRSSYEVTPEVVRIDLATGEAIRLENPHGRVELPGTLREVETTAADGSRVRAWLALPEGASADHPAPLALWIHGGPLGSWNAWSWRWCPWLLVARGYAVLLPDPRLSTGYGQDFIQQGWGAWGAEPFTDLMDITDAVEAMPEIDAERTAAMGGSFGGYMANWVAGHTDRFDAIVTHASLWALDQFGPTTDASYYWSTEMTPQMTLENSPHRFVGDIVTPMLVIHGDKDYRVPIGEGLRLWWELLSSSGLPAAEDGSTVHRFLYFPDENHWILTPQHAKLWYETVIGFLAENVLGQTPPPASTLLG